jgi:hypothetical protein
MTSAVVARYHAEDQNFGLGRVDVDVGMQIMADPGSLA